MRSFLLLEETKKLNASPEGFDSTILSLIEQKYIEEAYIHSVMNGIPIDHKDILRKAGEDIPKGDHLIQEYMYVRESKRSAPIRHLQEIRERIELSANRLEGIAAKELAARNSGVSTFASAVKMEHAIGQRYAELIEVARGLENMGVISPHYSEILDELLDIPSGPLAPFYEKALAIIDAKEEERLRHEGDRDRGMRYR